MTLVKRRLISLAQLTLGIGLIAYIFARLSRSGELGKFLDSLSAAAGHSFLMLVGILFFGICIFFCTVRWQMLLRAQNVNLPFRRTLSLYFIGQFFNAFLFGATGGDVVKAYYVATETNHRKAEVVSTVFIDRLIGLLALLGLVSTVMLVRFRFFMQYRETRIALATVLVMVIGAILGLVLVFRRNVFERFALVRRLEKETSLGELIGKVYTAFQVCLGHKGLLKRTLLLSLLNHIGLMICAYYFGMALEIPLSFVTYLSIFPLVVAIGAIPLTPGGLGTRESAAILLLGLVGVSAAKAVTLSLFIYVMTLIWSLAGGVVYFAYNFRKNRR